MADVILVDFFDTVMYREIHSSQLIPQWEKILKHKYNIPGNVSLREFRDKIINDSGKKECALDYKILIHKLYLQLNKQGYCHCDESEFYEISYKAEVYIDLATQYPNRKMVAYLKRQKKKGKRIFLVTDYYLPVSAYRIFLGQFGLEELFEKIYCSSEHGKTKWEGTLYEEVLKELDDDGRKVCMIGDSWRADVRRSKDFGIRGRWFFPLLHKIKTNTAKYLQMDFKKVCIKKVYRKAYRYSLFSEYGINLYFFSKKLYGQLVKEGFEKVNFLSRGGYLLKKIYDNYQKICVHTEENIETAYLYNSRKANRFAVEDEKQKDLLVEYFRPHIDSDNRFCMVDEGWNCSSQISLNDFLGCDTYGFYIGLLKNYKISGGICTRTGILFHMDENEKKDLFYGVFRTNLTFYEQMLQAPEGAVEYYIRNGDKIDVVLSRDDTERTLYDRHTKVLQQQTENVALQLMVWEVNPEKKQMALLMLKTLLFANKDRSEMLRNYQELRYDNFEARRQNWMGDGNPVKISWLTLLARPEDYMRYFCKVKEAMNRFILGRYLYYPIGLLIWLWCGFSVLRKSDNNSEQ